MNDNLEAIYNQVISNFYGINCDKCEINDSFWVDYINLKINFNSQCQIFLRTLFQ